MKRGLLLILLLAAGIGSYYLGRPQPVEENEPPVTEAEEESGIQVRSIEPEDPEIEEEWERVTDETDLFGVYAVKTAGEWNWQVSVAVTEFIREDPLESSLVVRVTAALDKVEGVTRVVQQDREVWILQGEDDVEGSELVKAVSRELEELAPQLRAVLESF